MKSRGAGVRSIGRSWSVAGQFRRGKWGRAVSFLWARRRRMGIMPRYLDPRHWLALEVRSSDGESRLLTRQDDGTISTVNTSVVATRHERRQLVQLQARHRRRPGQLGALPRRSSE